MNEFVCRECGVTVSRFKELRANHICAAILEKRIEALEELVMDIKDPLRNVSSVGLHLVGMTGE